VEQLLQIFRFIEKNWGLDIKQVLAYFGYLGRNGNKEYRGYSFTSIIYNDSPKKEEKIKSLIILLRETFKYDFNNQKELEGYEDYYREVVSSIYLLASPRPKNPFLVVPDSKIAASFKGLYLGVARFVIGPTNSVTFSPYLLKINANGDVELKSQGIYYRTGFLAKLKQTVYFFLNSVNQEEPELYLTTVPLSFTNETFFVSTFVMCGTWMSRDGMPAYGSTLLVIQDIESECYRYVKKMNYVLSNVEDEFFEQLERSDVFKDLSESEEAKKYEIRYLTTDNVRFTKRKIN
jgi:hypothetical protein